MTRRFIAALLMFVPALLVATQASAEKRVALVIGNGKYVNAGTLANPVNDATDMAAALKGVGFTVVAGYDLDKSALEKRIREFGAALSGADTGVFFYAGHGLQVAGTNYIVPIDAELSTADALDFEMIKLDTVQRIMESAAKTNILFLDACRNNPLARNLARALGTRGSGIGRGLAPAESGVGTLISFSTQPGNVAQDGTGRNSPYTGPLVKRIATQGEDILSVLTAVRNDVLAATGEQQVPWENHALRARYYFSPGAPQPQLQAPMSEAALAWEKIKDLRSVAVFEGFRKQYGAANPLYDTLAAERIDALRGEQTALAAPLRPTPTNLENLACDGLLVSVAMGPKTCIKPGTGKSFKDCGDCPEMVVVPSGSFLMGSPEDEKGRSSDEGPQHRVTISEPFAVGRFAVTFAEWEACVADRGCAGYQPNDQNWGRGNRPVINVNWDDAKNYLKWLSNITGKNYRLLSEAEREYVTRAGASTPYWLGSKIEMGQANFDWDVVTLPANLKPLNSTAQVNTYTSNPWGLYQVHGNIQEWVEDCWSKDYVGARGDGSAKTDGECQRRVLRGGGWKGRDIAQRSAFRDSGNPTTRYQSVGFRVARTLTP